jgi:hypothetical protein
MRFLIIVFAVLSTSVSFAQNDSAAFQILYKSSTVSVSAEKALYEMDKSKHFFIHYQIKNLTENNIGVYTEAYFGVFYPNQWGVEKKAERSIIDERRVIPMALNDSIIQFIETKYKNSQLTLIPPGWSFDYYRDFNASRKKDVKIEPGEFMFISMDGQLLMTDGSKVEHAHFDDHSLLQQSSIFLPYPLTWKQIPADSKIFHED